MLGNPTELRACLISLEQMLDRARHLAVEYDEKIRKRDYKGSRVESLDNAISFPEVRSLDELCKDAIARSLLDHPEIADQWSVHGDNGLDSPEDLVADLMFKRTRLRHALALVSASEDAGSISSADPRNLPSGYRKLADPVQAFFEDMSRECQDYERNVFIMTCFQSGNQTLSDLDRTIRSVLHTHGLMGHRADDRCYPNDRNLWDNVCTYMFCCKYGVAVLEDIMADEFNPNVALEYGFMRALGKPTLLLKERRFKPRADILGTVWHEFDILNLEVSVTAALSDWVRDLNLTS